MRHTIFTAVLVAATLVAPATASAGTSAGGARAGAGVRLLACETGPAEADRAAAFEGRVRAQRPGQRLQMRFTLQVSTPGASRWRSVSAPGFGVWYSADPGVTRWTYAKRVQDLLAPASYRAKVRFRWRDARGTVVARTSVVSSVCKQPDLRPDLTTGALSAQAAGTSAARYAVEVRNTGRGEADATILTLGFGSTLLEAAVPALDAGETRTVTVTGPRCQAGSEVELILDPASRVDERDEDDNTRLVPCPAI
jgi:CARDB